MKQRLTLSIIVILVSFALVVPGLAGNPVGPVTIKTKADFTSVPISGTFETIEGASELGCSFGTFVDIPAGVMPPSRGTIAKVFTCEDGGTGTFTANFQPNTKPGQGDRNGQWNITDSSGTFVGLHGQGDFSSVFDGFPPLSAVETLSGEVHYEP